MQIRALSLCTVQSMDWAGNPWIIIQSIDPYFAPNIYIIVVTLTLYVSWLVWFTGVRLKWISNHYLPNYLKNGAILSISCFVNTYMVRKWMSCMSILSPSHSGNPSRLAFEPNLWRENLVQCLFPTLLKQKQVTCIPPLLPLLSLCWTPPACPRSDWERERGREER